MGVALVGGLTCPGIGKLGVGGLGGICLAAASASPSFTDCLKPRTAAPRSEPIVRSFFAPKYQENDEQHDDQMFHFEHGLRLPLWVIIRVMIGQKPHPSRERSGSKRDRVTVLQG